MPVYAGYGVLAAVVASVPVYSEASGRAAGPVAFTIESYMERGGGRLK